MDDSFLAEAIEEARQGVREGGIPIGSILVHGDKIIGRGHNRRVQRGSAILHGEMDALENAGRRPASVYRECILYTTLSPCSGHWIAALLFGNRFHSSAITSLAVASGFRTIVGSRCCKKRHRSSSTSEVMITIRMSSVSHRNVTSDSANASQTWNPAAMSGSVNRFGRHRVKRTTETT